MFENTFILFYQRREFDLLILNFCLAFSSSGAVLDRRISLLKHFAKFDVFAGWQRNKQERTTQQDPINITLITIYNANRSHFKSPVNSVIINFQSCYLETFLYLMFSMLQWKINISTFIFSRKLILNSLCVSLFIINFFTLCSENIKLKTIFYVVRAQSICK